MKKTQTKIQRITFSAMFLTLVIVSKQALAGIPNVQVVTLLMLLYFKNSTMRESVGFVIAYSIIDYLIWGFFTLIFPSIFVWLSWNLIVKKFKTELSFALLTVPFTIIHAAGYLAHDLVLAHLPIEGAIAYLLHGLPFNIVFMVSSFITILWLYRPLQKVLEQIGDINEN